MATIFYDPLINWQRVTDALDAYGIDGEDRPVVMRHIEHTVHTEVLIVIITNLSPEKHEEFIEKFHQAPYEESHLKFIQEHSKEDVQQAIKARSNELIEEILLDFLTE